MGIRSFLQLSFFMLPFAPRNKIPPIIMIVSAVLVILSSVSYTIRSEVHDIEKMKNSIFGQMSDNPTFDGLMGLTYMSLIMLYLLIDTILPFLPPLVDCSSLDLYHYESVQKIESLISLPFSFPLPSLPLFLSFKKNLQSF
jgi:hypothetical protein